MSETGGITSAEVLSQVQTCLEMVCRVSMRQEASCSTMLMYIRTLAFSSTLQLYSQAQKNMGHTTQRLAVEKSNFSIRY